MATIKSYTDINQSRKLQRYLPLESADMCWQYQKDRWVGEPDYQEFPQFEHATDKRDILCWSLASLLSVIPKHIDEFNVLRIDISTNDFAIWYDEIGCGVNNELPDITMESAVDACVAMIEKLHELKML